MINNNKGLRKGVGGGQVSAVIIYVPALCTYRARGRRLLAMWHIVLVDFHSSLMKGIIISILQ